MLDLSQNPRLAGISSFLHLLSSLVDLDLSRNISLKEQDALAIGRLENLTHLDMSDSSHAMPSALGRFSRLLDLEVINLDGLETLTSEQLKPLRSLRKLRRVFMDGCIKVNFAVRTGLLFDLGITS